MNEPTQDTAPTTDETETGSMGLAEGELVEEVSIDGMCGVY